MAQKRVLPKSASVAVPVGDTKLSAPSAERNSAAILGILLRYAPKTGLALEIASGTGQHVVAFAQAMPGLVWQPSDIDPARRASIDAWAAEADLNNILSARHLDATIPGWGHETADLDLVLLVNLLHLISNGEAKTVLREASEALAPGGCLILYGPFLRGGETTSEGDTLFHTSLRSKDPEIGYKDEHDITNWIQSNGLKMVDLVEMPANNLCLIFESIR